MFAFDTLPPPRHSTPNGTRYENDRMTRGHDTEGRAKA